MDSGSTRSLVSQAQFQAMQRADPRLNLRSVVVQCVTASGQSLGILGETVILVKIEGFTWKFPFLVSQHLWGPPILGTDFMSKTRMILDVAARKGHFDFAPEVAFKFVGEERSELQVHTVSLQDKVEGEIVTGDLTTQEKHALLRLVEGYPDVFTSRLGLTRLIKYDIQVKDPKPVRLAPYRLSPPKMKFLREHIQSLLSQGISSKLSYRWKGPFIVDKFLTKVTVRVVDPEDPASVSRAHLSQIKPAFHD